MLKSLFSGYASWVDALPKAPQPRLPVSNIEVRAVVHSTQETGGAYSEISYERASAAVVLVLKDVWDAIRDFISAIWWNERFYWRSPEGIIEYICQTIDHEFAHVFGPSDYYNEELPFRFQKAGAESRGNRYAFGNTKFDDDTMQWVELENYLGEDDEVS